MSSDQLIKQEAILMGYDAILIGFDSLTILKREMEVAPYILSWDGGHVYFRTFREQLH